MVSLRSGNIPFHFLSFRVYFINIDYIPSRKMLALPPYLDGGYIRKQQFEKHPSVFGPHKIGYDSTAHIVPCHAMCQLLWIPKTTDLFCVFHIRTPFQAKKKIMHPSTTNATICTTSTTTTVDCLLEAKEYRILPKQLFVAVVVVVPTDHQAGQSCRLSSLLSPHAHYTDLP